MVKYNVALCGILIAGSCAKPSTAFLAAHLAPKMEKSMSKVTSRKISASSSYNQADPYYDDHADAHQDEAQSQSLFSAVETLSESLSDAILRDEALDAQDESLLELRKQRLQQRRTPRGWLVNWNLANAKSIGLTIAKVEPGRRFAPEALDLDSLSYTLTETLWFQNKIILDENIGVNFNGLVVISVEEDSQGWIAGVRPGDVLVATSATIGDGIWPKTTLEGVMAAISSRKLSSSQVAFKFQRSASDSNIVAKVDNTYVLTLTRPLGLEIDEDSEGYVIVRGFTENASNLALKGVQIGDRILAVGSTLGDIMWPVSTVEGVISACTARLPGQKVTMRFERTYNKNSCAVNVSVYNSENIASGTGTSVKEPLVAKQVMSVQEQLELLRRCRQVLKRYWSDSKTDFVGKNRIQGLVADKVVDAVASASASLDAVTLSMVMNAYLSCERPDAAIHIFQAATGLNADGSTDAHDSVVHGTEQGVLVVNRDAVNLFTASSAMQAYAMKGDFGSAKRILAAIEGHNGILVDGKTVASWPGTGLNGMVQSDTVCYNTALSAAASSDDGISDLLTLFSSMSDQGGEGNPPVKDIVSYNTVISALDKAGRSEEALAVFCTLKQAGIKPDKFTYTSLIRSCANPLDVQELLYDMKELGVKPDIVTYNTVIKTLCDRSQWFEAKNMIFDMESNGVKPNSMTYGLLMTGLMKAGKHSSCLSLFESACSDPNTMALTENVHLYTTAISAAASLKNHEKAFHLINRMKEAGVRPNMKSMSALMSACLSSGMTNLAVDVYREIKDPDGIAMTKGLEAMAFEGNFADVSVCLREQWSSRNKVMSGKQIMDTYTVLLKQALKQGNLESARTAFRQLLQSGFIPSRAMYQAVIAGLDLVPPRSRDLPFAKKIPEDHFRFLLFVLDSIGNRNLGCDGTFYATTLLAASRMGGLYRKIGSLLAEARVFKIHGDPILKDKYSEGEHDCVRWESLSRNYDDFKKSNTIRLPRCVVCVNKSFVGQILSAEKLVTPKNRRPINHGKIKAKLFAVSK